MRTKTLLLTAATVVAGFLSAQADTVYSQNVVGYVNVTVPGNSYYFLGNQLTNAGSGNDIQISLTNGPVSDPNGNTNTLISLWNGSGYTTYAYFTPLDGDNYFGDDPGTRTVNGWYDPSAGSLAVNKRITNGVGNFIKNASPNPITLTLVGQVVQGANVVTIASGYSTYSVIPPIATNIDSGLLAFPGQSDPNGVTNDLFVLFNAGSYSTLTYFTALDGDNYFGDDPGTRTKNGWYDGSAGTYLGETPAFQPKVGQAFFIFHPGQPKTWNYSFSVQ